MKHLTLIALSALSPMALAGEADVIAAIEAAVTAENKMDDSAIAVAMVGAFDSNGDGMISVGAELKAITCPVWAALDRQTKMEWQGTGARVIYGFSKNLIWVGGAWNIDEKARKAGDKAMAKCGL